MLAACSLPASRSPPLWPALSYLPACASSGMGKRIVGRRDGRLTTFSGEGSSTTGFPAVIVRLATVHSRQAARHFGAALLHPIPRRPRGIGAPAEKPRGGRRGTPVEVTVAVGRRKRMRVLFAGQTSQQRRLSLSLSLSLSPALAAAAAAALPDRVDPCAVDHRLGKPGLKTLPLPGGK
ncbi:hypothetical protein LY76DRAFT_599700 [Colletotrichum caudatum]|nr:hypothetical protein LY76DRAFT_599700 [Colletotrichum caudatum]